jgi:4-hydroxybenzoate polyprenyltransferase
MLRAMTRSRLIQVWFATILVVVLAAVALGVTVTLGTGVLLFALSLVPPAIALLLWPRIQPMTAADVLYDRDQRG